MHLIILFSLTYMVWAGNVDFYHVRSMEKFQTTANNSLFGYSTAYDKYNKRLIIGAPTENNIGEVYECNITTHECSKISKDIKRNVPSRYKHDYWFGATVRAGSDFIVACAPRFTITNKSFTGMFGQCYNRSRDENKFGSEIRPKSLPFSKVRQQDMDNLGWDMDIGIDDSMIVGGPAMYKRKGLAAISTPKEQLKRITDIEASFNFGYSVAIGYFINEDLSFPSYAIGSTFGTNGFGQVYFYNYDNTSDTVSKPMTLDKGIDMELVGSMFGGVLCAAKLNKRGVNKRTDLLVGAPTYATNTAYNAGAVYVYVYFNKDQSPVFKRKITNDEVDSFFGSAITNLGDLNGDGYDEIAIGAPYEKDGLGAVYLFSGVSLISEESEKTVKWMQKLQPEGYRSFGLSIAALKDYDENGCNELAIGAPYNGTVTLYKCMAAITITELSAIFPDFQNRTYLNATDYKFKVCVHVTYPPKPVKIVADISTNVTISHMFARLSNAKNGVFTFKTSLATKKPLYCENVNITLPLDVDYSMEISYNISTELLNSPMLMHKFESPRVILSDVSKLTHTGAVWAGECSGVKECKPKLNLTIIPVSNSFKNNSVQIIGTKATETLNMIVENTGDVAYDPCVDIKVSGASLRQLPMNCLDVPGVPNTCECTSRKPVMTYKKWPINDIVLNLLELTNKDNNITIDVTLFNRCDIRNKSQSYSYVIHLKSSDNIEVKGITNIGDIMGVTKEELIYKGKDLEHIYTIVNNGVTNFVDLIAEIQLQKHNFIQYSVTYHAESSQSRKQEHNNCNIIRTANSNLTAHCKIKNLPNHKQNYIMILVSMNIEPNLKVYEMLKKQNVTVNSTLTILADQRIITIQRVSSIIQLRAVSVDIWIYIVAAVVGLFLFIIFVFILYECGYLRRKNKENLERLIRNVNRQTIRRSMMQQSQAEDVVKLLPEQNTAPKKPNRQANKKQETPLQDNRLQIGDSKQNLLQEQKLQADNTHKTSLQEQKHQEDNNQKTLVKEQEIQADNSKKNVLQEQKAQAGNSQKTLLEELKKRQSSAC